MLPGRLILGQVVLEAAVDYLVDVVGRQLEQLPLFVVVAGELVSPLPFLDLPLQEALRVGRSGRELDLERLICLIFFFALNFVLYSLLFHLLVDLLPDLDDVVHEILQSLLGQPPCIQLRILVRFAELDVIEEEVQLWQLVLVNLKQDIVFVRQVRTNGPALFRTRVIVLSGQDARPVHVLKVDQGLIAQLLQLLLRLPGSFCLLVCYVACLVAILLVSATDE